MFILNIRILFSRITHQNFSGTSSQNEQSQVSHFFRERLRCFSANSTIFSSTNRPYANRQHAKPHQDKDNLRFLHSISS